MVLKRYPLPSLLFDSFPSYRMVSEDTGDGGSGPISSPMWRPPPPLRPPLGLLPQPRRAKVEGVHNAHYEEVDGGASDIFRKHSCSYRIKASRPMQDGARRTCIQPISYFGRKP